MSWFESITAAIQDVGEPTQNLSMVIKDTLSTLSKYDRIGHNLLQEIKTQEKKLQERLETEMKDKSASELLELDEAPYQEALRKLSNKRQRLTSIYDYQMKIAQSCYDLIDKKIVAFDSALQPIASQMPNILPVPEETEVKTKRKKSNAQEKVVLDDFDAILDSLSLDPNEPKYCLCRRVSYGEMVGCENPDCRIEWFHFKCVGLKKAPSDTWYCPQCTSLMRQNSVKVEDGDKKHDNTSIEDETSQ